MSQIDQARIKKAIAKQGKFWLGPASVRIPWHITSVPQFDEVNRINMHLNKNILSLFKCLLLVGKDYLLMNIVVNMHDELRMVIGIGRNKIFKKNIIINIINVKFIF